MQDRGKHHVRRILGATLLGAVLGLGGMPGGARADEARGEDEAGPSAERVSAARAALRQASAIKSSARGEDLARRHERMEAAGQEYEKVAVEHADVAEVCGEAWFRAGEVWRVLRRLEEAERCFTQSTEVKGNPRFGARSQMEIAHARRRAKELAAALEAYEEVERRFADQRLEGVRALTWAGKVLIQMDRVEEGHRRLLSTGERYPDFPVEHVRNVDVVAVAWVEAGRADEAAELVRQLRERYATAPEDEKLRAKVHAALDKMKASGLVGGEDG